MLTLPSIPLSQSNKWLLETSGLSARIVNATTDAGFRTVADLRKASGKDLLALNHFGERSLNQCTDFLQRCEDLSAGALTVASISTWIEYFTGPDTYEVLSRRYGFFRADPGASRNFYTLQDIANRTGRSRERIRQVEEMSFTELRKELPRAGLLAGCQVFIKWLKTQHGSATWESFHHLHGLEEFDGASPASLAFFSERSVPGHSHWAGWILQFNACRSAP